MADEQKPTARHNFSARVFPVTYRIYSGKTGELLWEHTATLDDARRLVKVDVPGYAGTEHYPTRVEISCADGTTREVMQ